MISFPTLITMTWLIVGMIVSGSAMANKSMQKQHETMLDMENIPKEVRPSLLIILSILYIIVWPILLFRMMQGL